MLLDSLILSPFLNHLCLILPFRLFKFKIGLHLSKRLSPWYNVLLTGCLKYLRMVSPWSIQIKMYGKKRSEK
jgi:hypothetical protein